MEFTESTAFRLQLMGRPRLHLNGEDVSKKIKYRKAWAVWAYLLASPGQWFTRDFLGQLLWPELDTTAARTNLRQVLGNLAGVLELSPAAACLQRDAEAVRWQAVPALQVDMDCLGNHALARAGAVDADAQAWRRQVLEPQCADLLHPFLQGLEQLESQDFQDWLGRMRGFYASRSALLLEQLLQQAIREGRNADATDIAYKLVGVAPAEPGYIVQLLELLHARGQHAEAVAVEESRRAYFREQFGSDLPAMVLERGAALQQVPSELQLQTAALQAEWRWVCALYGEAPASEDLEEEDWPPLHAQWSGVVERFGGAVQPLPGNGWLAIFGLAGAGERVALRALLAAEEWRAMSARRSVRFGIADGKLLHTPTSAHNLAGGEVVKRAMGICWVAQAGQILLTEGAVAQIGTGAQFEPAGTHQLPGAAVACELMCLADRSERARMADGYMSARSPVPMVGRAQEFAQLAAAWRKVQSGQLATYVIRAPAGYGKTRLASELLLHVTREGGQALQVSCRLETHHQPLAPFMAALQSPGAGVAQAHGKSDSFSAVLSALQRRLAKGPMLLWVDDLHWADLATLEFLPVMMQALVRAPVLLLVASRPGLAWEPPDGAVVVELPPLGAQDATTLLNVQHGGGLHAVDCQRVLEMAGGVPLFLELLSQSVTASGGTHPSIHSVLQTELDALGEGKRVLRAAAVLGSRFKAAQLAALLPVDEMESTLRHAEDVRLLHDLGDGVWEFHHALIYDAVYASVPLAARKQWHVQVARRMESEHGPAEEIAQHWAAARAWREALQCWVRAGDEALEREFAADALACFERAMAMFDKLDAAQQGMEQVLRLRLRMGYALQMAEGFGSARAWKYFDGVAQDVQAASGGLPDQQDILFAALGGSFMGGSSQGRVDGLTIAYRMEQMAISPEQRLMAASALGNSLFWRGDFKACRRALEQALALADALPAAERTRYCVDDPALVCRAFLAWTLWFQGDHKGARTMVRAALAIAEAGQGVHSTCFGYALLLAVYWCQGEHAQQAELAQRCLALAKKFQFPLWESVSSLFLLCSQARSGYLVDAKPLFEAAQHMQTAYQAGITTSRWLVADALVAQKQWTQALALLERSISEASLYEDQYCLADLVWLKAECLHALGQPAQALFDEACSLANQSGSLGLLQRYTGRGSVSV